MLGALLIMLASAQSPDLCNPSSLQRQCYLLLRQRLEASAPLVGNQSESSLSVQAVALALAKVTTSFQYVPPVAVAATGLAYLALANLLHYLAAGNLVGRSANQ